MDIRVYGLAQDSVVDGPGLRLAVYTQGCPHRCMGCHNPGSHDFLGGSVYDTEAVAALMEGNPLLDGLTLSGGEPFAQPGACLELARAAKQRGLTVWAYSGYTWEQLRGMDDPAVRELLDICDVLVDGPFVLALRSLDLDFCGSRNQRLIDLKRSGDHGVVLWRRPEWGAIGA